MAAGSTFVFVGGYRNLAAAQGDYELVSDLHEEELLGTYDAAIVIKRTDGTVTVTNDELLARHGAWTGLAVGAVLGIIFPPSIVGAAAVGGVAGGVIGHLWRGMSRGDVKELGEALDAGQSALIVIGEDRLADVIDAARLRAVRQVEKEIDADGDELKRELEAAARQAPSVKGMRNRLVQAPAPFTRVTTPPGGVPLEPACHGRPISDQKDESVPTRGAMRTHDDLDADQRPEEPLR